MNGENPKEVKCFRFVELDIVVNGNLRGYVNHIVGKGTGPGHRNVWKQSSL